MERENGFGEFRMSFLMVAVNPCVPLNRCEVW